MEAPARLSSAVVELAGGFLRPGYHHSAALRRNRHYYDFSAGGFGFLGLRKRLYCFCICWRSGRAK